MLLLGRWSVRMVWPSAKVAGAIPKILSIVMLQFHVPVGNGTLPLTLSVLITFRSGAVTVTTLALQLLLVSSLSVITLPGSAVQVLGLPAGLAYAPTFVAVA